MISCSPRMRRHWSGGIAGSSSRVVVDAAPASAAAATAAAARPCARAGRRRARALRRSRPRRSTPAPPCTNGSSRGSAMRSASLLAPCVLVGEVEREHVAVDLEERRLARRIAHRAVVVERRADRRRRRASRACAARLSGAQRPCAARLTACAAGPSHAEPRIEVRQRPALQAQRMELARAACAVYSFDIACTSGCANSS